MSRCRVQRIVQQWSRRERLQQNRMGLHTDTSLSENKEGLAALWTWGRGEAGQLGHGEENTERSPSLVTSLLLPRSAKLAPMPGRLQSLRNSPTNLLQQGLRPVAPEGDQDVGSSNTMFNDQSSEGIVGGEVGNSLGSSTQGCVRRYSVGSIGVLEGENSSREGGVGIACGLFHSALWAEGKLWLWGKGDGGRLGLGSEVSKYTPTLNPYLTGVKSAALGGLHSAAITTEGTLYTWGFGGFGALGHGSYEKELMPKLVDGSSVEMGKVVHIAAGGAHTAAVDESGKVFTWGRDEGEGRLGHIDGAGFDDGVPAPVKVRELPVPIAAIACGGFFTMALTPEGQLWSWGGSSNYELGRGDTRGSWKPRPVPDVENMRLIQVSCGGYHAAAVTDDGKVLTWGHGGHGQLGHGNLNNAKVPSLVEALADLRIVFVACGSSWTAAVTESGELYSWGKNRDCQLGVPGLMDTQMLPVLVTLQHETDQQPDAVAAGANHGLCLAYSHRGGA